MSVEKVHFDKEKETMLMTLYGRAVQSHWPNPILRDPWAEDAVQHIDYDFGKVDRMGGVFAPLIHDLGAKVVATRAATFDLLTRTFLKDHPDAVVLHPGCGMDSRVFRLDPPASVEWYDVDYPDVIDLRRQLFPERDHCHLIGAPLDDLRWLDAVPGDHPVLLVAEGVLPYLSEPTVRALLNAVTQHFPSGQLAFDVEASWVMKRDKNVGDTGASYQWALDDPQDIHQLEPKLELVKEYRTTELVSFDRFPPLVRGMFRAMEPIKAVRRMERIVVYRF
ncbi:MAG TPA: class I SAM-dependent methyltransferase [Phototrophicaceae bacterium]|nr:class I SAM-dependent methyltransferase [Phototrophicaceae bacterium]